MSLRAGGLFGVLVALVLVSPSRAQTAPSPGGLVINEVLYAPDASSTEWIELYNRSDAPIDLGRLEYADGNRDFSSVAPQQTLLRPDSFAVLVRDSAAFADLFPAVDPIEPDGWEGLNNGGDLVLLRDASSGTVLDSLPYTPSWGGADGRSLERIDPAGPSYSASNFGSSTAERGATPGRRNSIYAPDERAPVPVFAEQTGRTAAEVTFSEPVYPASVSPSAFDLGSTTVIEAALSADTVVALTLASPPGASSLHIAGVQDLVGNGIDETSLPLALRPDEGDFVVNEIMYAPRSDDYDDQPNQVEYVEIRNRSGHPLTLNGLFLTDQPDETGTADTTRLGRPRALPRSGYAVLAAAPNGAARAGDSQLAEAFPDAPLSSDSVAYLPADAARLGLQNDGDLLRVHRADGTPIAGVTYSPDWHTPSLEDPKGTALERISSTGPANAPDNWASSPAPTGGTPGTRNALSLSSSPDHSNRPSLTVAPSPFSPRRDGATRIRFTLPKAPALVRVRIFDARGRRVRTLEEARLAGPTGELLWNGRDGAGHRIRLGIYVVLFEAVRADGSSVTRLKEPVVVAHPLD